MCAMARIRTAASVPSFWSVSPRTVPQAHLLTKTTASARSQPCAQRIFAGMGAAAISLTVAAHPRSDVNTPVTAATSTTALRIGADVSAKSWLSVKQGTPGAKSCVIVFCRLKKNLNARINVSLAKIH